MVAATSANLFYLTDFYGSGAGVVEEDRTLVVTTLLERDRAKELGNEVDVIVVKRWAEVAPEVARLTGRSPVVVDDDLQFRRYSRFTRNASLFLEARRRKDREEVERITAASRILDAIFKALEEELRPGKTEWQVAAEVMKVATERGAVPSASDSGLSPTIIASGENGALPHSELTGRKIRRGDLVVADIFFRFKGYNSDSTRTFAVGAVSAEKKKCYEAVKEAQESALEMYRVGSSCGDVNDAAFDVLKKYGLDRKMSHSLGHGVGIDIHESPSIYHGSTSVLADGDVVTDEPGVYFKGKFGVRIEDTVLIGSKPNRLTRYTRDLVTVG